MPKIAEYMVSYYAGGLSNSEPRCRIWLYDDYRKRVGLLIFHRQANTLPAQDSFDRDKPWYELHFHSEDYPRILDLLRNETPLYVGMVHDQAEGQIGWVGTMSEPVGEGENHITLLPRT